MKRYIRRTYLILFLAIIFVFFLTSLIVYAINQRDYTERNLRTVIQTAAAMEMPDEGYQAWVTHIVEQDENLRVTLIDENGQVLADTDADAKAAENHVRREEVDEALTSDWGAATRKSATTNVYTLYVARDLGDGLILRVAYPLVAVYTFIYALLAVSLLLGGAAYLFMRAFSNRFADRLLAPMEQIDDLLNGKAPRPDAADAFPETAPLVNNINARIVKLNSDMTEIQRTQQIRSDFVENASHELKTPLTSIKGFSELLATGMVQDEKERVEYLGRIISETDRLLAIIEDILHLSMAERGPAQEVTQVDLKEATSEIIKALMPLAKKKNISLEMAGSATVRANAQEMWEMLYNLIDNAIRYGREGGYVKVKIDRRSVTIVDNGIGMPEEQLPRVFERFYRVDTSHGRTEGGGTGLGLSIVRHIAQKYGGNVEVQSRPSDGSTFTIMLWDDTHNKEDK